MPLYIPYNILKPVKLEFVYLLQHKPQLPRRKAFVMVPYHIMFGQVYEESAFIFPKGHFCMRQLYEEFFLLVQAVLPVECDILFDIRVEA